MNKPDGLDTASRLIAVVANSLDTERPSPIAALSTGDAEKARKDRCSAASDLQRCPQQLRMG